MEPVDDNPSIPVFTLQGSGASTQLALPKVPQRTTPGFVFSLVERAIKDGLSRRAFGADELRQVIEFFGPVPPECVFCGATPVTRWDHLIPISTGGETVLGNMVPACGRCDDSKQHRPYEEWMTGQGASSLTSRGVQDIPARLERLKGYAAHFGYSVVPLIDRLTHEELDRLTVIRQNLADARSDLERLIISYRMRTSER